MNKLPIKASYKYNPGDDLKNHPHDFMFRAAWNATQRNDIPVGKMGVLIRKESTKENKFILVPVSDFDKFSWTEVINPAIYSVWNRK